MNSNISPNQFAFKGMAKYAHPLAKHLRKGVMFKENESITPTAREDMDDPEGPTYRVPRSFDPPVSEHGLLAIAPQAPTRPHETVEGTPGRLMGQLHWRGDQPREPRLRGYPGEITWVAREQPSTADIVRDPEEGIWKSRFPFPKARGLMTNMFKFAHQQVAPGQSTVPVHSPDRSREGEAWSAQVGPPELRPQHGDFSWRPPEGIHPFERAGSPRQLAPAMEGQLHLPGVLGHVLKAQRQVEAAQLDREDARLMGRPH